MILYDNPLSSHSQKVKTALRQKGGRLRARAAGGLPHRPARYRNRHSQGEAFAEFDEAAARMAQAADLYRTGSRRREYRDHRVEWMIRSGGIDMVLAGLRDETIRFSWLG
jgi:RNA polymerase-associated protein